MKSEERPVLRRDSEKRISLWHKQGAIGGYTLLELVVTVAIMATLAAVAVPTYLKSQGEAKAKTSVANMIQIKQAFVNHFYNSVIDGQAREFPEEPSDNEMTTSWANSTTLYNGRSVAELFSGGQLPYNPNEHPYLYYLLPETPIEVQGFKIKDPDMGIEMDFRP